MIQLDTATPLHKSFQPRPFLSSPPPPAGEASEQLRRAAIASVVSSTSTTSGLVHTTTMVTAPPGSLQDQLYSALATCKIRTATVAMHLDQDWRTRFFSQLDNLLAADSWDPDDVPASEASFTTLLRMILFIRGRRPGLGATAAGNFIATWTEEQDRLTVECKPLDQVRWVLIHHLDGDRESAAGETTLPRLLDVLAPYDPQRWLRNAPDQAAG
jgi:hypothetical protein